MIEKNETKKRYNRLKRKKRKKKKRKEKKIIVLHNHDIFEM